MNEPILSEVFRVPVNRDLSEHPICPLSCKIASSYLSLAITRPLSRPQEVLLQAVSEQATLSPILRYKSLDVKAMCSNNGCIQRGGLCGSSGGARDNFSFVLPHCGIEKHRSALIGVRELKKQFSASNFNKEVSKRRFSASNFYKVLSKKFSGFSGKDSLRALGMTVIGVTSR